MLSCLTVKNLAVVEQAEASFGSGLTVITGETGAGKSVLMHALDLVLGGKADASVVRDGAREAEVEAEIGGKVVRRTVTASGRSRAWIDDESVSLAELKDFGRPLVDIHGPMANQTILEESFQRTILDVFGGIVRSDRGPLRAYEEAWRRVVELRDRLAALEAVRADGEIDMLRFQVDEISSAGLTEEDETIAERHAAAAHAGEIVGHANAITDALGGDGSAAETLIRLLPQFRAMARHLAKAEDWAKEAEDLTLRIQELSRAIADEVSKLDTGADDLDELDRRLSVVNKMKRKYAPTVCGILEKLEEKRRRLDELEHCDERRAELGGLLAVAEKKLRAAGAALTKRRFAAAEKLSAKIVAELRDLGFLQARFSIALEPVEPFAHGMDRVVFMFEPNPGEAARPLQAIASSGEIARVMLAVKSVLAAHDSTEVLVFDEIDANIGGEVGRVVGEKLRAVAKHHQVVAITHLPQSAAYGDRHLVVSKRVAGGRTRTEIAEVTGKDRVSEIARMLGGEKLTSVVRKHAEELLQISR